MNQNKLTKKNATTWIHSWLTGYQLLTFESDDDAKKWAKRNGCDYRE